MAEKLLDVDEAWAEKGERHVFRLETNGPERDGSTTRKGEVFVRYFVSVPK